MPEGIEVSEIDPEAFGVRTDEELLAELGYKQELNRSWSGFSNFAISFSIISILAGCFTTFASGWNGGGPAAIAWGWPVLAALDPVHRPLPVRAGLGLPDVRRHLLVGVEARWGQGGLLHRMAEPDRPAGHRGLGRLRVRHLPRPHPRLLHHGSWHSGSLDTIFLFFVAILVIAAVVNIFSSHLLAIINNISVWWHVLGAAAIVLILIFLPRHHASASHGLHLDGQQHRLLRREDQRAGASSSSCCPSAAC